MSTHRHTFIIAALIVLIGNVLAVGDWKEDAKAIDISGGEDHTLVLTKNKWAWACGDNYYYQLGIGSNVTKLTLVRVAKGDMNSPSDSLENIDDVDAGWTHSLALDVNNFVWAWGRNAEGQLGDGWEITRTAPVRVKSGQQDPNHPDSFLQYIVAISAGRSGRHSLAVDANGYAYAWGYNKYGQSGNDVNDCNEWTPVRVHRGEQPEDLNDPNDWLKHILDICAGADQSIAVEKDDPTDPNFNGCVYTWGTNRWGDEAYESGWINEGYGLLGTGSNVDLKDTPVKVLCGQQHPDDPNQPYLNHIVAVTAGWDHCLALEKDDPYDPNIYNPTYTARVYAWGNNGRGYGGGHYAEEWEASVGGRLGDGSYDSNSTPVLVLSGEQDPNDANSYLEHIIAISAGEGHSMALDANGYVYCWGDNQYGQLGNGRNEPCSAPVRVVAGMQNREDPNSPLSGIVAISAGHWHSLAIDSDGVVWVWGKTKDGRLGLADMAYANPCVCAVPHRIPVVYNQGEEEFWFSINDAIDDPNTASGDVLEASCGVYYESVDFKTKGLTLQSQAANLDVAVSTVIDGSYSWSSGVRLYGNPASTLAGFTVTNSWQQGIYEYACSGASVIRNNIIRGNIGNGIYGQEFSSGSEIKNNWIYGNGAGGVGSGIYLNSGEEVLEDVIIRHNTIANNAAYGIETPGVPDINNCIIWGNGSGSLQYNDYNVSYSCVEGTPVYSGTGNINGDPCFVDDVNDDYHLTWNSPCVDWGDPNFAWDANETDIDGNPRVMGDLVDMGADEDFPHCDPNYPDWVLLDRPNCWMTEYQCDGDADCATEGILTKYRVSLNDLNLLIENWKRKADHPALNPCADIDHKPEGVITQYRVSLNDLNIVIANWKKRDKDNLTVPPSMRLPGDCAERGCQGEALGGGSPGTQLTSKELLQWLAEIWLDPDVRKSIDEEKFLKVYESLKELE